MDDFELTDYGIEALISAILSFVALLIISAVPTYGALLAFLLGLAMVISSVLSLFGIWIDWSERPFFWIVLLGFGVVYEFGAITDIAAVLPAALLIDVVVILISAVAAAVVPIASTVAGWLDR